jgi:type I protein arginine methyltransferase
MASYKTNKEMVYRQEEVWFPLSEDILSWDFDFHDLMLNDHIRMTAYEKAIKEVVKPGMTVIDIGTGTGILAGWAFEAGSKKIYGIDVNSEILKKATERIKKLGYSDKYTIFNALSYEVNLPEQADVIISEILGNLGDNEDMTPILEDARKRFLKKDGVFIPKQIETYVVPIASQKAHERVSNKKVCGINQKYNLEDLMNKLEIKNPFNLYYDAVLPKNSYLSSPQLAQKFDFSGNDKTEYKDTLRYKINKNGPLTGFKGYFVAQLSHNTILDISGDEIENRMTSDCWKHCYLPIENPFEVQEGDDLELVYSRYYPPKRNTAFRQCYSWKGKVKRNGKVAFEFSQKMC